MNFKKIFRREQQPCDAPINFGCRNGLPNCSATFKAARRTAAMLTIFACLLFAEVVEAEIQTYEGVGVYIKLDSETQDFAKRQAKLYAERDVLEQIYFYIESQSLSKNSKLVKDDIITVAAGRMEFLQTKFSMTKENGLFVITATVIVKIDPDEIPELVEREKKKRLKN